MRLDASYLHFISREQIRILTSIEIGMRNHEYVSKELITRIGNLRGGETFKTIQKLLKHKFIVHIGNKCDGYKLTYLGYDYLALNTFIKRGLVKDVICKIGVGKESDIYKCRNNDGDFVVLKLTRLGRTSFRSIKNNREYIQNRTSYNWLYLSRLSSIREFLFMQLLHKYHFPVPTPIDTNRHGILMSLIDGDAFCRIQRISTQQQIRHLFDHSLNTLVKFAQHGLIHGDYNQFNILVNEEGTKITVIDFPQCVSAKHPNAKMYFDRDVECIYKYFDKLAEKSHHENMKDREEGDLGQKRFRPDEYPIPQLESIEFIERLDHEIKHLGHITLEEYNLFEKYRSEEDRIRAEMEQGQNPLEEREQGSEDDEEQESQEENIQQENQSQDEPQQMSKEELESEETQLRKFEEKNELLFNEELNAIQSILQHSEAPIYDEELTKIISHFEQKLQTPPPHPQQAGEQSSQEEERFKGMTPYEIRMKIKEEKRIQRQQRKEAMSTDEIIKKSLKKGKKKVFSGKGNHGNKDKIKQKNLQIKGDLW